MKTLILDDYEAWVVNRALTQFAEDQRHEATKFILEGGNPESNISVTRADASTAITFRLAKLKS